MKFLILLACAIVMGALFTGCGCTMNNNSVTPTVPVTTAPLKPETPSVPAMTEPSLKPNIPDPSINDGSIPTSPIPSFEQQETEN